MPIVSLSSYTSRPLYLFNKHLETIIPSVFRKVTGVNYERERMTTSDGDFLDLDWLKSNHKRLAIITHGLEGSSHSQYVMGMGKMLHKKNYDVVAWNCRSCSGEMNLKSRMYHHGDIGDIKEVLDFVSPSYEEIVLIGFSMGGCVTIKYLGVHAHELSPKIKAGVTFSVPMDLKSSAYALSKPINKIYLKRFLSKLEEKVKVKAQAFPDEIPYDGFKHIKSFPDFDNQYTAPMFGFEDAHDLYFHGSAKHYMSLVKVPTLVVNAWNDPMLPEACFPIDQAKASDYVYLEIPKKGGHVGFSLYSDEVTWAELRAVEFLKEYV